MASTERARRGAGRVIHAAAYGERPDPHALAESHKWESATGVCQWSAALRPGCDVLKQGMTIGFLFGGKFGRSPPRLPSENKRMPQSPIVDGLASDECLA